MLFLCTYMTIKVTLIYTVDPMPWRSSVIVASDPTFLTFCMPRRPRRVLIYVLLMITYHYLYGTARIQDQVYTYTTWKSPLPGMLRRSRCVLIFSLKYPCMTTNDIVQNTSVHFTIYPRPYSCMSRWYYIIDSSTILVTMYYCGYVVVWLVAVHGD